MDSFRFGMLEVGIYDIPVSIPDLAMELLQEPRRLGQVSPLLGMMILSLSCHQRHSSSHFVDLD